MVLGINMRSFPLWHQGPKRQHETSDTEAVGWREESKTETDVDRQSLYTFRSGRPSERVSVHAFGFRYDRPCAPPSSPAGRKGMPCAAIIRRHTSDLPHLPSSKRRVRDSPPLWGGGNE